MDFESQIRRLAPIHRLPQALQDKAVALAEIRTFERGHTVYQQGDGDLNVHYLLARTVELIWHDKVTRRLSAAHKVALRPLDPPGRKRYTVRATDSATAATFKRIALDRLIEQSETFAAEAGLKVSEIATARSSDWMIRMLQSELFSVLPATNIQKIFARMEQIALAADDVVVRQGELGQHYYVIEKGYCEVSRRIASDRGQIHHADLGPGTAFGEEALISNKPRNATVTMLSDGLLMRLEKADFDELILSHVLCEIDFDAACARINEGAVWLDIRYPEEHAEIAFTPSENIPVNMLRLQSNRLRKDLRYIVCGNDVDQAAIAAFLLGERGFMVEHLDTSVAQIIDQHPTLATRSATDVKPAAAPAVVVTFPGAEMTRNELSDNNPTYGHNDNGPLENTITKIASLYTHEEAKRDMNDTTPTDQFAETATGQALADIIDELSEHHDSLAEPASDKDATTEMDHNEQTSLHDGAYAGHEQDVLRDGISLVMREMEDKLRHQVARAIEARTSDLEADYRSKLERMRELTNQEIDQKEARLSRELDSEFTEKEQLLRSYYKKLIALANKISKQKAKLQDAKKQFEIKLKSANQLYREVEEMRELLANHIGYLDQEAIEEIPKLSISL